MAGSPGRLGGRASGARLCQFFSADRHPPGVQDAFILRQLPHKARVGARDAAFLLHVVVGFLQGPAKFLHRVGYDRGSRATDAHFAMYQALGVVPPAAVGVGGEAKVDITAFSQVWHSGSFFFKP